jgi:hypothetical protein
MPNIRKLTPEEVLQLTSPTKGVRKQVEAEYDAIMADYSVGEYGVAELGSEENRLTVRNRLKAAAERRGFELTFRRTKGPVIRFQVMEKEDKAPVPEPVAAKPKGRRKSVVVAPSEPVIAAPAEVALAEDGKKKRGRPKKEKSSVS